MASSYVTASEIGEFTYCKRAWWLRTQGIAETTDAMMNGTAGHNRLARLLYLHKGLSVLALLLIGLGILGAIVYIAFHYLFHIL